jgi:hypothetical protein
MAWATKQLIRDAARQSFWAVPNTEHRPARTFDDPQAGQFVPRWGSAALLKLAVQAQAVHLVPVRVDLRDVAKQPLSPEHEQLQSELLVSALRTGDLVAAQAHLHGERGPYAVVSVTLMADDGTEFAVGRYGTFDTSEDEPTDALVHAAESILSIS